MGANIYSERPQFYINRTVSIFSGADLDNWILDFDFDFFFQSVTAPSPTPINSSQTDGFEAFSQYKSFPENRGSEMRVSGSERRIGGAS